MKTFTIPEVIYDLTMLLSILFRHKAFLAESLNNSPDKLSYIREGENELHIPLCEDIKDCFVFRQAVQTDMGWVMSDKPMRVGTLGNAIKRVGELAGSEHSKISYGLRYMVGSKLDQNGRASQ